MLTRAGNVVCDACGRFIGTDDLMSGAATHTFVEPDSDRSKERFESECAVCVKKSALVAVALPQWADPTRTILFAIEIDDHYERLLFLKAWSVGDWDAIKGEWPEFINMGDDTALVAARQIMTGVGK